MDQPTARRQEWPGSISLAIRCAIGIAGLVVVRLLLETRLPGGAAMGIGFAVLMAALMPTIPSSAYEKDSRDRRMLYSRMALFLLAGVAGSFIYELIAR